MTTGYPIEDEATGGFTAPFYCCVTPYMLRDLACPYVSPCVGRRNYDTTGILGTDKRGVLLTSTSG